MVQQIQEGTFFANMVFQIREISIQFSENGSSINSETELSLRSSPIIHTYLYKQQSE